MGFSAGRAAENSCVDCHRTAGGVAYMEHNFADWTRSAHAIAGIACQSCHGGDPHQDESPAAHAGVLPSTDPDSPVFFTRVPATCGVCHEPELKAFRKSAHDRKLQRSGRGPNCVTCHGSMANQVMGQRELDMNCTPCHPPPGRAYAALSALNEARLSLERLREALQEDGSAGNGVKGQELEYQEALRLYGEAVLDWHAFKTDEVSRAAREAARRSADAMKSFRAGAPGKN